MCKVMQANFLSKDTVLKRPEDKILCRNELLLSLHHS